MSAIQLKSQQEYENILASLSIETRAFIGGQFISGREQQTLACINPANGQLIATVAATTAIDADIAVAHARNAFARGVWSQQSPRARKMILLKWVELIHQHTEELALLESIDVGKPIHNAIFDDVLGTANAIQWFAESIDKVYDQIAPTQYQALGMITREPLGVVAAIVPWNFPLLMSAWKIGPALATGNSLIIKPSEKSPLSILKLAQLGQIAGIPDGVFQVLPGFGHTVGKALSEHMDIDAVTFTGSTRTGKTILAASANSNLKRVSLELGGKSANIILNDVKDIHAAVKASIDNIFYNQGQMCSASSRLLLQTGIKDEFIEALLAYSQQYVPQNPLNPKTKMGAIVDAQQLNMILEHIKTAKEQGAHLLSGGLQIRQETGGYYIQPTIFNAVTPQMNIFHEEVFGPVLSISSFTSPEEAIALANHSEYGLGAALWTRDLSTAHLLAKQLRAGTVWVNNYEESDITVPFGGYKSSGIGRDKSLHALEKYTELKTTWIKLA